MIDQEALAAFSSFTIAFLQRLLLYPGGLFGFVIALLCARLLPLLSANSEAKPTNPPQTITVVPAWAQTAALALCWGAWAFAPLPGAQILTWQPDAIVTLFLLIAGGLLDSAATGTPITSRKASGYGLLLAATLIWLLAGQTSGDLIILIRALSGLAYLVGLLAAFSDIEASRTTAAGWLYLFFWFALPVALIPAANTSGLNWPTPANLTLWLGASIVAAELILGSIIIASKPTHFLAKYHWPWAWLILAIAMLLLIFAP